jgi:protein-S-isoprenylcysteine O-methyltransferase Ste14
MGEGAGGALSLAGDVIAGGATLSGLILVYLGSVTAGFSSFEKPQQGTVRKAYQHKAWLAVIGILFGLAASGSAVFAKWQVSTWIAGLSILLLIAALAWAALTAVLSALEVK